VSLPLGKVEKGIVLNYSIPALDHEGLPTHPLSFTTGKKTRTSDFTLTVRIAPSLIIVKGEMSDLPLAKPGPHDEFELSAYDRISSPPSDQVKKGMAEQEGLSAGKAPMKPKVFKEIDPGLAEATQTIDFDAYLKNITEEAGKPYKELAKEHTATFKQAIEESDKFNEEQFDLILEGQKEGFKEVNEKLDTLKTLTQGIIKITRDRGEKPMASLEPSDRAAIEAAAYKRGFDAAQANAVKARKSLVTQVRNLRLLLKDNGYAAPAPDEDIEEFSEDGAETLEEFRARKEAKKERDRERKADDRQERDDPEWKDRFKPIVIPSKKRPIHGLGHAALNPSSSSSSSSGAFMVPANHANKKPKVKKFCEDCLAETEDVCICEE